MTLTDGAVYCLGLTPYQYTARAVTGNPVVSWLLVPVNLGSALVTGPPAYVTHDGAVCIQEGKTEYTAARLHFTGRYTDGRQQDNV